MAVSASAKVAADLVARGRCLSQAWLRHGVNGRELHSQGDQGQGQRDFRLDSRDPFRIAPGGDSVGGYPIREGPVERPVSQVYSSSALLYDIEEETTDTMRLRCRMTPSLPVCSSGRSGLRRPLAI
jgi:hypothetical protein